MSQFEKASIVAKLRGARERKRAAEGKREGRKSHGEARLVDEAEKHGALTIGIANNPDVPLLLSVDVPVLCRSA